MNIQDNLLKFFIPPAIFLFSLALAYPQISFQLIRESDIGTVFTYVIILLSIGYAISSSVYVVLNPVFRCLGILGDKELDGLRKIGEEKIKNKVSATRIIRKYDFATLNFNCVGAILLALLFVLFLNNYYVYYQQPCSWWLFNILFLILFLVNGFMCTRDFLNFIKKLGADPTKH